MFQERRHRYTQDQLFGPVHFPIFVQAINCNVSYSRSYALWEVAFLRAGVGESLILFFLCLPHLKVGSNITEFPLLIKDVFLFTFKHSWNQKTSYN